MTNGSGMILTMGALSYESAGIIQIFEDIFQQDKYLYVVYLSSLLSGLCSFFTVIVFVWATYAFIIPLKSLNKSLPATRATARERVRARGTMAEGPPDDDDDNGITPIGYILFFGAQSEFTCCAN